VIGMYELLGNPTT